MAHIKSATQYIQGAKGKDRMLSIKHFLIRYIPKEYDDVQLEYALERVEIAAEVLAKRRIMNSHVLMDAAGSIFTN